MPSFTIIIYFNFEQLYDFYCNPKRELSAFSIKFSWMQLIPYSYRDR